MSRPGVVAGGLLLCALAAGTMTGGARPSVSRELGGHVVLAADFHVHSFPFTWSTLSSWDTVLEARRQGLDVIAMTPHNAHLWVGRLGRWFSHKIGGPLVIVSEEVAASRYHLIATGIRDAVSARLSASDAIDDVHRQGGVAIAAHPYPQFVPAYADAIGKLDGAEIVRPESLHSEDAASALRAFSARAALTAIGSSDYHGFGSLGYSRTYVFARSRTEQDVLDAVRDGRTVVYGRDRAYGDPALIALAAQAGLPREPPVLPVPGAAALISRLAAVLALSVLLFLNQW